MALVRRDAAIPTAPPVQSTDELDWSGLGLDVFADDGHAEALVRTPEDPEPRRVVVDARELEVVEDPLAGRIQWAPRRR